MEKTSTIIYSIHNLSSKTNHQITDADDIAGKKEFGDIYELLDQDTPIDVRDEIVEKILKFADRTK